MHFNNGEPGFFWASLDKMELFLSSRTVDITCCIYASVLTGKFSHFGS